MSTPGIVGQNMFDGSAIPVLEQLAKFAQARHGVLAGNIANFDTPGYRVRDLSPERFQARLKDAIATRDRGAEVASLGSSDLSVSDPVGDVDPRLEDVLFHDDSNGGLEEQVAEISKNQMQHNLAMSVLGAQYRLLQVAISERIS